MRHSLALALLAATLLSPSLAAGATVDADVHRGHPDSIGPVTFRAAPGEANRLAVSGRSGYLVFRDRGAPLRALGDCRRIDAHAARCPSTESIARIRLGDGADRARVGSVLVAVFGGAGDDVLTGARSWDRLDGGEGDDRLSGGRGGDHLRGGGGRDRLLGGAGDDELVDGERDGRTAPDVYVGGSSHDSASSDRGDVLDYSARRAPLRIDLGRRRTSTEDRLVGLESLLGGRGSDNLTGDGDDNQLAGGPGEDVLSGGNGDDIPMGGPGDDRVSGDVGNDVVWGDAGRDRLAGGDGDDLVVSGEEQGPQSPDEADCGAGEDSVSSDATDTLADGCESVTAFSNGLHVSARPGVVGDRATFGVSCTGTGAEGCHGTIRLTGPAGQPFGATHFALPSDEVTAAVTVGLSPAAVTALAAGTTVRVDLTPDVPSDFEEPGGYRLFIRAP